ncbi:MAG: endolytic transglycosylase MltG [Bacteroidales bacterium]|jgi:UPF0755 protein|nr:endolytic transglycosylase MltG [Bacteroidales bacterium]
MSKKKIILISISVVIIIAMFIAFMVGRKYWNYVYASNVKLSDDKAFVYIPTGSGFENLLSILQETGYIEDIESFKFVAEQKNYTDKILPGKYEIKNKMSNNELINLLRSGKQTPVRLSFISLRNSDILAGKVSDFIEADSVELVNIFKSPEIISKYGFKPQTFISMFIPNTYEFYWNTSAEKFIERMAGEYKRFWNDERKAKANALGMSQSQVSTLASIVEEETQKNDEKARIAGVYINRLKKGMLLQADPTVKYAVGDPSLKRILHKHLKVESPYNTYIYQGLPPGPICIPSISSIDAVLDYEKHKYMYFCAKDDFSGYHTFAVTHAQHNVNAKKYHDALRKAGIR